VSSDWEDRAAGWIAWARKPSHDAYAYFRGAFFSILPPPPGRTLEVGCGEGCGCGYPLAAYASPLESAGFVIESLRVPTGRDTHDRFLPEFPVWRALEP
jgi:hypothetical protein